MTDEIEIEYGVALIPAYLSNGDPEFIAEGRRAYVLELLVSAEGVLAPDWNELAPKLEDYLINGARKSGFKVVE